jgi:hypothetical protein
MSLYVPYYRPYNKHNTNIPALGGIRTYNPSKRAAVDPRLRPHGQWDRPFYLLYNTIYSKTNPTCFESLFWDHDRWFELWITQIANQQ